MNTAPKYIVEVKTLGHWRPYVNRDVGVIPFTFKALAIDMADRLRRVHNLETQVVLQ